MSKIRNKIEIGGLGVGQGCKAFLIAEVAQAHDGSLGIAHSYIDAAAESGVDAIKFQTHIAAAESTKDDVFRVPMSGQDQTRYDYWKRMEFTSEQWAGLAKHAEDRGLLFLSSAFSLEAVELLDALNVTAWKIGSGEFRSHEMLQAMAATAKPIIYSTGMCRYDEIDAAVGYFNQADVPFALLQCVSQYPAPLENVGLNVIDDYKVRYNCVAGLSDHTGTIFPSLAAMARGSDIVEVHVTFDRRMYGPDAAASLTFPEIEELVCARDAFHVMQQNPVDKDTMADELEVMRNIFTKSIALKVDLPAGTVLSQEMLAAKKPGTGIPFQDCHKIVGKKLLRDVSSDRLLKWGDIENAA